MPSRSLQHWEHQRCRDLDELEKAHRSLGGNLRGRRYATQQVNHGYLLLLSSQFQGFCRDLHSECIDFLVTQITPLSVRVILREAWATARKLDKGNPSPENLQLDFERLGFDLQGSIFEAKRKARLHMLNHWRNAIAHQDFDPAKLGGKTKLGLAEVREFRKLCNGLAEMMDACAQSHLRTITGKQPWL
jgi:hypothetical protein